MNAPGQAMEARRGRRAWRVLIWLAAATAMALLACVAALAWLAGTTSGSRWALARAAALADAEVRWSVVEGSIAGGLTLRDLHVTLADMEMEAGRGEIDVDWSGLPVRRIVVRRLELDGLGVTMRPVAALPPDDGPGELPGLRLPVDVLVQDARIERAVWRGPGGDSLAIDTVRLKGAVRGDRVALERLRVTSPMLDLDANGELRMHGDWPLALAVTWIVRPDSLPQLSGAGEARGSLARLEVTQRVEAPHPVTLTADLYDLAGRPRFDARLRAEAMPLTIWMASAPRGDITADLRLSGTADAVRGRATGRFAWEDVGVLDLELDAARAADTLRIERLRVTAAAGALDLTVRAVVGGIGGAPGGEAHVEWTRLAWPPAAPTLRGRDGTLSIAGTPAAWTATLDAEMVTPVSAPGRWRFSAHGDTGSAQVDSLAGTLLGGAVRGSGHVRWSPAAEWQATIDARDVDPGTQWPEWRGALAAHLETEGHAGPGGAVGQVRVDTLRGRLRGRPIDGAAVVRFAPDEFGVSELVLGWGAARLTASGDAGETWSMQGALAAPDLGLWLPGAAGTLDARWRLQGPRHHPRVFLRASGDSLGYDALRARHVEIDADADLSGATEGAVSVTIMELAGESPLADSVMFLARGTPGAHEIEGHVLRGADSLDVAARGGWGSGRWDGWLSRLDLLSSAIGVWRLERPARIEADTAGHAVLDSLEWVSGAARLAARAAHDRASGWNATATLEHFDTERLTAWLPEGLAVRGPLDARLGATGAAGAIPVVSLSVTAGPGEVTHATPGGPRTTPWETGQMEWRAGADGATGTLDVTAPGLLVASARVRLPVFGQDTPLERQPIDGRLSADIPDLTPFAGLWPDADSVRGSIHADLRVAGLSGRPLVTGAARLEDGAALLRETGMALRDAAITLEADGSDSLQVHGSFRAGPGTARIRGRIDATRLDSLHANLTVEGERLLVMNRPDARLLASPDLRIAVSGTRVDVGGEVRVPRGDLVASSASTREAATLSADVVIEDQGANAVTTIDLHTSVRVVLGDSLALEAFGLKARPRGTVLFTESPGREAVASGELTLTGGTYRAYGQDLTIERGRLLFAGGPVSNPGLDIRASRTARDGTIAGIEVRGTALAPLVSIFSEPDMPEEEALSYIVLGRPLEDAGTSDGELLASAARSAGLRGGNLIAAKVASEIGLDEASIDTKDGSLEEASLMLGTYLSPRVYLGYAVGLFKPANAFLIRYRIGSRWALEAEAAEENSAEIQFTIER